MSETRGGTPGLAEMFGKKNIKGSPFNPEHIATEALTRRPQSYRMVFNEKTGQWEKPESNPIA